jgi:hypothetical protein
MEHNYRISHRIGDSSFELESTDKNWIDEKEKEYLSRILDSSIQPAKHINISNIEYRNTEDNVGLSPNLTINEFYKKIIKSSRISSRPDLAVFFIYYLSKISKKDSIKTPDVQQCFAEISYPNWNKLNVTDILGNAKRKGFLNNVNAQWLLTMTGEDFVLNLLTNPDK